MKDKLLSTVRSQDFFGHQISLNFDRKGDRHNTIIGGFFSIFIRAFIAWYVILKFLKLIQYDDDTIQYNETLVNLNETGEVSYADTEFTMFFVLKNLNYKRKIGKKDDDDHF